jgi:hypothetical protein
MRPGEKLVRQLIAELSARVEELEQKTAAGKIGPYYRRYCLRWLHKDYDKLESIAKRWGFNTE